jgi:hypothetical protein
MSTVVEELVAVLGLDVDKASFNRGENALSNIASLWTKIAGVATAAGGLISGAINQNTAHIESMASAIGVSGEFLEAIGDNVKALGFDFENAADLIEEMNNKLGESKGLEEITPVKEALEILNLNFKDLQKLAPEEQFRAIGNAALKLKDQQKAVSAVDILMGGEANKIFGYMRSTGQSFDDLIDKQIAMNFQTAESRKGAVAMTKALAKLTKLFTSLTKLLAGLVGKYLAPAISGFVDMSASMVQVVKSGIDGFIDRFAAAMRILLSTLAIFAGYQLVTYVISLAKAFNLVKLAAMAANAATMLMPILIGAAIGLFVALAQDIYTYFSSGGKADTALGRVIDWLLQFDIVQKIIAYFQTLGAAITSSFTDAQNKLADFFMWIDEKISAFSGAINAVKGFFGGGNTTISPVQNNVSANDLPPIPGTSGAVVTNNIQIDATGMDKNELNAAIDERTGQLNAIAARNNSTGMVF